VPYELQVLRTIKKEQSEVLAWVEAATGIKFNVIKKRAGSHWRNGKNSQRRGFYFGELLQGIKETPL